MGWCGWANKLGLLIAIEKQWVVARKILAGLHDSSRFSRMTFLSILPQRQGMMSVYLPRILVLPLPAFFFQGRFFSLLSRPAVAATPPMFLSLLEPPAVTRVALPMEINERLYPSNPSTR